MHCCWNHYGTMIGRIYIGVKLLCFYRKPVNSIISSAAATEHGPLRATVMVLYLVSYESSISIQKIMFSFASFYHGLEC